VCLLSRKVLVPNKCGDCKWHQVKSRGKTCEDRGYDAKHEPCGDFDYMTVAPALKNDGKGKVVLEEMTDSAGTYILVKGDSYPHRKNLPGLGFKYFKKDKYWWANMPGTPEDVTELLEKFEGLGILYDLKFNYVEEPDPISEVGVGASKDNDHSCGDCRFFREPGAYKKTKTCKELGYKPADYCPKFELEVQLDVLEGTAERHALKSLVDDRATIQAEVKDINVRWEENNVQLKDFMLEQGVLTDPKDVSVMGEPSPGSRTLFESGWKIMLLYNDKKKYSEKAGIDYCKEHHPDCVIQKDALDWDRFYVLVADNQIQQKVVDQVITPNPHYSLRVMPTKEQECPSCGQVIDKNVTFCPHCGHNTSEEVNTCSCGITLAPDSKFCSGCGSKVA
jgi:zinc-ribbon domain